MSDLKLLLLNLLQSKDQLYRLPSIPIMKIIGLTIKKDLKLQLHPIISNLFNIFRSKIELHNDLKVPHYFRQAYLRMSFI